jgi:polyisoprenoid-binding protein YceI
MKRFNTLILVVLLIMANNTMAQNTYSISTYTVTIDGTSNLHSWNEKVGTVSGKGIINWTGDKSFTLQSFNIAMQVNSIKSDEGSTMNNKTYKALKGDQFPVITFLLAQPVSVPASGTAYTITVKGNLTIAGVTRLINIPIKISVSGDRKINIEGAQQVKMTDYGVDPPTALFGVLKTGDAITISFNTTFLLAN